MSVDILTNEGSRALNHSITSGVKLYIEDAVLVNIEDDLSIGGDHPATEFTAADIPDSVNRMTPVACLPVQVETEDENVSALDTEFLFLPKSSVSYNTIVVRARYYYPISTFDTKPYGVGNVVSYGAYYYKCKLAYTYEAGMKGPDEDSSHWETVQIDEDSRFPNGDMVGDTRYKAVSGEYIALYVSQMDNAVTLTEALEVDYKLRLFLTNTDSADAVKERIYFETLGPSYTASEQLNVLAAITGAFANVRSAVTGMIAAGATSNTLISGTGDEADTEEEEMRIAYFKTPQVATYEFTGADTEAEVSVINDNLHLTRMDNGSGTENFFSAFETTDIVKARVTMGGTGTLESQAQKAADITISVGIPTAASSSGSFYEIQELHLTLSRWNEWEDKSINLDFSSVAVSRWKSAYQNTKPVALQIKAGDSFFFMDYNIQDAFVGQDPAIEFPIFLEIGATADKFLDSNMTSFVQ